MGVKEDIPKNAAVLLDFVQINTKIQPKKQFKVQIIGILEEINSFYWPKMHLWKGDKKFGQGPPPLIWTKSKRWATFFRETFPKWYHNVGILHSMADVTNIQKDEKDYCC